MHPLWRQSLLSDHRFISHLLDIILDNLNHQFALRQLKTTLNLLLEFTDRYHNIKEENYVFPLLIERGVPKGGAIHRMVMEHESERELLIKVTTFLKEPDSKAAKIIYKKLNEYIITRKNHMQSEEKSIFTRVQLMDRDNEKLKNAFDQFEIKVFNKQADAYFDNKLAEIERKATQSILYGKISADTLENIIKQIPFEIFYFDCNLQLSYTNSLKDQYELGTSMQACFKINQEKMTELREQKSITLKQDHQKISIKCIFNDFFEQIGYLLIKQTV